MHLRHQLAVHSPISLASVLHASAAAFRVERDRRPLLSEALLRAYGADSAVLCGSGTQALQVAITARLAHLDQRAKDGGTMLVALPAFCCFDVASAAVGAGARIALYDLDPDTLAPDEDSLERVLRAGAGVVVIAPLYGLPADWEALEAQAARHGALLIEDAAQGQGAAWKGRPLGSLAGMSVVSFGRGKGWTGGNGGAVLVRGIAGLDGRLSDPPFSRELATIVALKAQWLLGRPAVYGVPRSIPALALGETVYRPPHPPRGLTRAAAAALFSNAGAAAEEAERRRGNAESLRQRLAGQQRVKAIQVFDGATPGYLRLPLRIGHGIAGLPWPSRASVLGVEASYPSTLAALPAVSARLEGPERTWAGADALVRELITVPTHSLVSDRGRDAVVQLFV